jgi:hypothetical protein
MVDSATYALNWLRKNGYGEPQAAAMVGHGVQESGFNPTARGDNGTAFGAFQWRGSRLAGLYDFAKSTGQDPNSLDTQLGYMDRELHTTEKGAGDALFGATNVRDAVRAGMNYERPAGWTTANPEAGHGWANRYGKAAEVDGRAGRSRNANIGAGRRCDAACGHAGRAYGPRHRVRAACGRRVRTAARGGRSTGPRAPTRDVWRRRGGVIRLGEQPKNAFGDCRADRR